MKNLKTVYDTSVSGHFETHDYVFFWGGPFSNWHPSNFLMIINDADCMEFNCAEQAMMCFKAFYFKDYDTARKIMNTSDPRKQKSLGRMVSNYVDSEWAEVREKFVYDILYAKFNSDDELKKVLFNTFNKEIVEASPYDTIWGIGMGVDKYPEILDKNNWKGQNLLGKLLMQVRNDLMYPVMKMEPPKGEIFELRMIDGPNI